MSFRRSGGKGYSARAPATREPYAYVLLVCEGKKTEPQYFTGLQKAKNLSNANIHIVHAGRTDPLGIVKAAESKLNEGCDKIYCIFDRNGHTSYDEAVRRVAQSEAGRAERLIAITSVPCFEVWLLMHFRYWSAPFTKSGKKSSCDKALRALKIEMPNYEKGHTTIYDELSKRIDAAIRHSRRLERENHKNSSKNPAPGIHKLVVFLNSLRAA